MTLLHGSTSDPELQQLLHAARTALEADAAAAAATKADVQSGTGHAAAQTATTADADPSTTTSRPSGHSSSTSQDQDGQPSTTSSAAVPCHAGIWQQVMAAVAHVSRLQIQHTMELRGDMSVLQQPHAAERETGLTLSTAERGQSFW